MPETQHDVIADKPELLRPSTDTVLQEEPEPLTAIPVRVEGPVEVRQLPGKRVGLRTVSAVPVVSVTQGAVRLVNDDPRRSSVTLIAITQDIFIGVNQSSAATGTGARIPSVVPFVLNTSQEVWASSSTGTTDVSIIEEFWTE